MGFLSPKRCRCGLEANNPSTAPEVEMEKLGPIVASLGQIYDAYEEEAYHSWQFCFGSYIVFNLILFYTIRESHRGEGRYMSGKCSLPCEHKSNQEDAIFNSLIEKKIVTFLFLFLFWFVILQVFDKLSSFKFSIT